MMSGCRLGLELVLGPRTNLRRGGIQKERWRDAQEDLDLNTRKT
jgi:hypothetical protein